VNSEFSIHFLIRIPLATTLEYYKIMNIPTVRILKSSRCFSQVGLKLLNNIPLQIINSSTVRLIKYLKNLLNYGF